MSAPLIASPTVLQPAPKVTPLIVEFVGLPGAGKTTVARSIGLQLQAAGLSLICRQQILQAWRQRSIGQRLWQLRPKQPQQWQLLLQAFRLAAQVQPLNRASFDKAATLFTNAQRLAAIAQKSEQQVILLDQGCLQEIWSIGLTASAIDPTLFQTRLTALLQTLFSAPTIAQSQNCAWAVVHCVTEPDIAIERIQQRSTQTSRFDRLSPAAARTLFMQQAPVLPMILEIARAHYIPILEINTSLPVEVTTAQIHAWILVLRQAIDRLPSGLSGFS